MTTILSAVYDRYDALKPLTPQDIPVDAIVVTDDPTLTAPGWRTLHQPRPDLHPNLAGKHPKMRPWDYTDDPDVVWIDASFRIIAPSAIRHLTEFGPLAQFVHPERTCVYDEAAFSRWIPKYAGQPLVAQADSYRSFHPPQWGLWEAGVIVRRRTPKIEAFGVAWLDECYRWTFQDQVSEAPMLNRHGLRPTSLPGHATRNIWLSYEASRRH